MNNWLVYRCPNEQTAQRVAELLQPAFDKVHFQTKAGHWGSLEFWEVRVLFTDKITCEKFVEMGILIGKSMKQ